MRQLSRTFIANLKDGFLKGITEKVIADPDLDLEIRDNYINIYFKGKSLLKLDEIKPGSYRPYIHPKYIKGLSFSDFDCVDAMQFFLSSVPYIKENIIQNSKPSLEIEYEQLLIRANNYEPRNNSEYFIVDRQYVAGKEGRFDLTGFYWPRDRKRTRGQTVSPCLLELKYALNPDIQHIHEQLDRYYQAIAEHPESVAEELECIFRQKLELGLFECQGKERAAAMKTLVFDRKIENFQFVVVLLDYNPYSTLFDPKQLASLTFANQVRLFYGGSAMWSSGVKAVSSS